MQIFETERLLLRRFTAADADNLVELDSDPDGMRYLSGGNPASRAAIDEGILPRFIASGRLLDCFGYWAAIERSTGDFLGWFGFVPQNEDRSEAALGYRLRKSVWGKGYATEGSRALIDRGFMELGVRRVTAMTYEHNTASRRVMEKLGMKLVRTFRMTPEELRTQGTFESSGEEVWEGDDVEYALEATEWV